MDITKIENILKTVNKKNQDELVDTLSSISSFTPVVAHHPNLVKLLPLVIQIVGNKHSKRETRELSENIVRDICTSVSPDASRQILSVLFEASEFTNKWQTRVLALDMINILVKKYREQMKMLIVDAIPVVAKSINDVRKEVDNSALKALESLCSIVDNNDVGHVTSSIIRSMSHPEEVEEIMHTLAGVTFVQTVETPVLAMVSPLLIRGLSSGTRETIRQTAVIIDNMSKLVDDPVDVAPFMPVLLPAMKSAAENMPDPEARSVCTKTFENLKKLNNDIKKSGYKEVDQDKIKDLLACHIKKEDSEYISGLCVSLVTRNSEDWSELSSFMEDNILEDIKNECNKMVARVSEDKEESGVEELCNCKFTLAYGTKVLLHNTVMRLKKGAKYGLLGGNDSGKTTLMRAIANGSVEGFPTHLKTVFVESDIIGELSHLSCIDYILADESLSNLSREKVSEVMATVGFTQDGKAKPSHSVSSLSGGWRMKLAMARAMLQHADILLLDEPTNHLDVINVQWVKNYINSLKDVTAIMVSHDSGFLRDCCTDIIQINRLKLNQTQGGLDSFIEENPDAKHYFDIKKSNVKFNFPQPGPIEGIKSRSRALMKMKDCTFTYPSNDTPTLYNISVQVSMASRVGCVGENGAGKSTMIKLLTGEIEPQTGEVWKHPNARVAYVAQHAFNHIERHMDKTPNEYIRWRYESGEDKESLSKVSMVCTPGEEKLQKTPFDWVDENGKKVKKVVAELTGERKQVKGENHYACRFVGTSSAGEGVLIPGKTLIKLGWEKVCKCIDEKIVQTAGMYKRTLSSNEVEKHLSDIGLEAEFATHTRMSALSGGQKVKVVLGAALWNQPHIMILDEPTNYLDRESLGALARAVEDFQGGVVIISHHNEFVSGVCTEEWVMDAGKLTTKGESGWMDRQDDKISDQAAITTMVDACGNTSEVKQKKVMTKKQEKVFIKSIKKKIASGEELNAEEEEYAINNNL